MDELTTDAERRLRNIAAVPGPRRRNFVIAALIVVAVIIYGSLYPFDFYPQAGGLGAAVRTLIASWAVPPSHSDLIANVLLYLPFGFFALLALGGGRGAVPQVAAVTLIGALLSCAMELAQYFDSGRVTSASDLYTNTAGTLLGAIAGCCVRPGKRRLPLVAETAAQPIPALLLAAWVGYRLFPFVPTIDLHKYWHAIRPLLLDPIPSGYDFFRYSAIWLAIGALIEALVGRRRGRLAFAFFFAAVVVGQVMIVDAQPHAAEIAGGLLAVLAWLIPLPRRGRTALAALLFFAAVVAERLEPFVFVSFSRPFGWIPFLGFMSGSLEIDILSFLQKFFLYGTSIWLIAAAGLRLRNATIFVAAVLFLTSEAERYLPNRSAEITDAVMALIIGAIFALLASRPDRQRQDMAGAARNNVREPARAPD